MAFPVYGDMPKKINEFICKFINRKKSFVTILEGKLENFFADLGWKLNTNPYQEMWDKFGKL